ncbi:MAG: Acetokinase family, partial [Frankiaceae bacterium]|nr:Acetokinase family [Frankiaceae bacterium]
LRRRVGQRLAFLGVAVDDQRNGDIPGAADGEADTDITASGSPTRTFVVAAREDLQLAAEARRVMGQA